MPGPGLVLRPLLVEDLALHVVRAALVVAAQLLVDLLYAVVDPRVREGMEEEGAHAS